MAYKSGSMLSKISPKPPIKLLVEAALGAVKILLRVL